MLYIKSLPGISRRGFLTATVSGVLLTKFTIGSLYAGDHVSPMSADEALQRLKEGHARFLAGKMDHPRMDRARIVETSKSGQHPFALFISCADSRVPVETIFDQGIGDLFIARVAGNVADIDEMASAEYGAGHLAIPLIVVMGHTQCGAVTDVVNKSLVGKNIATLISHITPAADRALKKGLTGTELINEAIRENVHESMASLVKNSEEIQHLQHGGKLKIVGAVYHLEDGTVEWLA